jgi:hypothetical protein
MLSLKKKRRGVTLVEMLVATAMCILGMWMLTWMFQQATASFSLANAQATLTGQQRMVAQIMTRDLEADKFPEDDNRQNRGRKLADQRLDLLNVPGIGYTPPRGGYFWAKSTPASTAANSVNVAEAGGLSDGYGFYSSRSADHFIQVTVILPDNPGNRFYADVPAGGGNPAPGLAAEISYFLVPAGRTTTGIPFYDLMRVQRVAAQTGYDALDYQQKWVNPALALAPPDAVDEVMTVLNGQMQMLGDGRAPVDLTIPVGFANSPRFAMPANPLASRTGRLVTSRRYGEDRLMSQVLSFEIKFTGTLGPGSGLTTPWPTPFANGNSDYPFDVLPFNGEFDTFSTRVPNWNTNPNYKATAANPGGNMKPLRITGALIVIRSLQGTSTRQTRITVSL